MNFCLYAVDDEIAVLGWFIADPSSRRKIVTEIQSTEAFEPSGLAPLWGLLTAMHAAGSEIDPATVRREAKKAKLAITDEQHAQFSRKSSNLELSIQSVRLAAMRRWMQRQGEAIQRAAADAERSPLESAARFHDAFGKAIRVASKMGDRGGGLAQLTDRLNAMASGKISNLTWPGAPQLTKLARPLESGSITMLSGSPGDGKTYWLLQSVIGWRDVGIRVSVCMLEKPRDWHLMRVLGLLAKEPRLTSAEWVRANPREKDQALASYASKIESIGESIVTAVQVGKSLEAIGRWIDSEADEHDVVVVDPISLADAGEKRWLADRSFINGCIRTCERTGVRIVLVSHPNATKNGPVSLSSLMGGVSYQRATDCVMHVAKLDEPKKFGVWRPPSSIAQAYAPGLASTQTTVMANRTVSIFKGRNGTAGGKRFAFGFDDQTLQFAEQGVIVSEEKAALD